jgi:hypothetical protein
MAREDQVVSLEFSGKSGWKYLAGYYASQSEKARGEARGNFFTGIRVQG